MFFCWELIAFFVLLAIWRFSRSFLTLSNKKNRPVFITGCDSGFGRLLAENLDKQAIPVYAGCLLKKSVTELQKKCSSSLKPVLIDVTDSKSVREAAEYVKKDLGSKALWGIVNNAGIPGLPVPFEWTTKEDCQKVLDVNLLGVYDVTLAFLPLIKRGKEGRVVNIASIYGRIGHMIGGYAMSKHGIEAVSDGLSFELQPYNITVHTLEPGFFQTNLTGNVCPYIRKRWSELDPEIQKQFGEDYCDKYINYVEETTKMICSPRTDLVVSAYERALFDKYPKNRYLVGNDMKFFFVPMSYLPFRYQMVTMKVFEFITGRCRPRPKNKVQ